MILFMSCDVSFLFSLYYIEPRPFCLEFLLPIVIHLTFEARIQHQTPGLKSLKMRVLARSVPSPELENLSIVQFAVVQCKMQSNQMEQHTHNG